MSLDAESLRRQALHALSPFGDERAAAVLERASLELEEAVAEWQGSEGARSGHRIVLVVDGEDLARLEWFPAVWDAVTAALASAVAEQRGETLLDIRARWGARRALADYRSSATRHAVVDDLHHVLEAAVDYLEVIEALDAASVLRSAVLSLRQAPTGPPLVVIEPSSPPASLGREERRAIEHALEAILRRSDGTTRRLVWSQR
jgi:hypothetical protein